MPAVPPDVWTPPPWPARLPGPDGIPAPPYGTGKGRNFRPFGAKAWSDRCACGAPTAVILVGTDAFPATSVNEAGMACTPMAGVEAVPDVGWCLACARAAGWPFTAAESTT